MVKQARRATRRQRQRRGMTVFVVMLVIMMLSAVGIFAARSSQLGVSNSGRYRAMLQTHFIAEAGMQGAIAEFSRDPEGYLTMLHASPSPAVVSATSYPCFDIPFQPLYPTFTPASTLCLRLGYQAVEAAADVGGAGKPSYDPLKFHLFRPAQVAGTGIRAPGSLGRGSVAGNFVVEFTDERPVETPPAGMAISRGPAATLRFVTVTARAMGQVVPAASDGTPFGINSPNAYVSSVETIRAEVMVGPIQ